MALELENAPVPVGPDMLTQPYTGREAFLDAVFRYNIDIWYSITTDIENVGRIKSAWFFAAGIKHTCVWQI